MEDVHDNMAEKRRLCELSALTDDERQAMAWAMAQVTAQELAAENALLAHDPAEIEHVLEWRERRRDRGRQKADEKSRFGSTRTEKDAPPPNRKYERFQVIASPNLPLGPTGRLIPGKTIPYGTRIVLEGASNPAPSPWWVGTARDSAEQAAEYAALDNSENLDNMIHDLELADARAMQAKRRR